LDERFSIEIHKRKPVSFLGTTITDEMLVDRKTQETLAKEVRVGSGRGRDKHIFWPSPKTCVSDSARMGTFTREIQNTRGKK
jgi:hypothetical protein